MRSVLDRIFDSAPYDAQRFDPRRFHYGQADAERPREDLYEVDSPEESPDDDDDAPPPAPEALVSAQEEPSALGCWIVPQDVVNRGGADRQNRYNRRATTASAQLAAAPAGLGGATVAEYDAEAFRTPFEVAQEVVCTGALINTYTGEVAQTYEDAMPEPNREGDDVERQRKSASLRLHRAQGGEPRKLRKREQHQLSPEHDAGVGHGNVSWQLHQDVALEAQERKSRDLFFLRNDEAPSELEMTRNPYGFRGFQNMVRPMPHMPLTQELDTREWTANASELPSAARPAAPHVRLHADAAPGRQGLASGNAPEPQVRVAPRASQAQRHLQQSLEPPRGLQGPGALVAQVAEVRASLSRSCGGHALLPAAAGRPDACAAPLAVAETTLRTPEEVGARAHYGHAAPWRAPSVPGTATVQATPELTQPAACLRGSPGELGARAAPAAVGLVTLAEGNVLTVDRGRAVAAPEMAHGLAGSTTLARCEAGGHPAAAAIVAAAAGQAVVLGEQRLTIEGAAPGRRLGAPVHAAWADGAGRTTSVALAPPEGVASRGPRSNRHAEGSLPAGCAGVRLAAATRVSAEGRSLPTPRGGGAPAPGGELSLAHDEAAAPRSVALAALAEARGGPAGAHAVARTRAEGSAPQRQAGDLEAHGAASGAQTMVSEDLLLRCGRMPSSHAEAHRATSGEVTLGVNRGQAARRLPCGKVGQDSQYHVPRLQGYRDARVSERAQAPGRVYAGGAHLDAGRARAMGGEEGVRRRRTPKPSRLTALHPGASGVARLGEPLASRSG
jgi:hypothetical protein